MQIHLQESFTETLSIIGLPIIESPEAAAEINEGDEVKVDFDTGIITDITTGKTYKGQAFPEFMQIS